MKIRAIVLACSLSASALAEAGTCRPLEYAEIKDTRTKELVETYCYYGALAKIYDESRTASRELFLRQLQQTPTSVQILEDLKRGWERTTAEQTANVNECNDQRIKMITALKARRVAIPSCDTASDGPPKPAAPK